MKALSIHPYYAMSIVAGVKTVECRTWKTDYRGDIVICSTKALLKGTIPGHALGVVELVDVVPFTKEYLKAAEMTAEALKELGDCYAWILKNPRLIKPIPVKCKLSLWEYTEEIEFLPWLDDEEEAERQFETYWKPLII